MKKIILTIILTSCIFTVSASNLKSKQQLQCFYITTEGSVINSIESDGSGITSIESDGSGITSIDSDGSGISSIDSDGSGITSIDSDGSGIQKFCTIIKN